MKRKRRGRGGRGAIMEENHRQQEGREVQEQRDRRSDALGDLCVLSDELVCAILDRLTPLELGRLACVSSVMYILCNEEPLWMSMCLRIPGPLEYRSSWKNTTLHRQNFLTGVAEPHENPFKFDGFYSLFLYRRWYRCFTTLDAFYKDNGYLERKETSVGDFQLDYSKPVLLTDLAKTWPARKTWTIDQFSQKYREIRFRISQRSSRKITMKFQDYVSYISCQHDEDPLYIFDEKFGESAPSLLDDYSVPSFFREDFFDVLDEEQRPPFRWLIVGPERSGASWHVDPALTSAWNTLLVGRKRWALYPPGKVPVGVTVHVNEENGDIDVETPSSLQWWLDIYPLLAEKDKPIECTQLPGETIFVPSGWWHCVLNLETTIAVTQNFVNSSNFEFVCLDFCPGHLHKGVTRAGWLAVQDQATKDSSFEDNDFQPFNFSYDVDFLSKFVSDEVDHFMCTWSEGNSIGQREFRAWLHRLWVVKPDLRTLVWKGACLALKADRWLARIIEICASNNLPHPLDDEKLPVGTGSNPVYLVSDYVIKLYVEGGLASSLYSLGTELEFYSVLHKAQSALLNHVPAIFSSGVIIQELDGSYKNCSWAGRGMPDLTETLISINGNHHDSDFPFGVWGKMDFLLTNDAFVSSPTICPYLITKRCRGDIFANLREKFLIDDNLNLASFLGDQMRNLHLLPLPKLPCDVSSTDDDALNKDSNEGIEKRITISREWKPFIKTMRQRKKDLPSRLIQWGDSIPKVLIDNVEAYIPDDPSLLIGLFKEEDDTYFCSLPSWVHSDVMDDNIHIQKINQDFSNDDLIFIDAGINPNIEGKKRRWFPAHIIDFSDLLIGDPLFDLIPIHIDVFRADSSLLKRFLESYRFPLRKNPPPDGITKQNNFERASYRAMCYCILHEDNVLGTIFSLCKDLRSATSWEEVEVALWGELNNIHEHHIS